MADVVMSAFKDSSNGYTNWHVEEQTDRKIFLMGIQTDM